MDRPERVLTALQGGGPEPGALRAGIFPQSLFGAADADEYFHTDVRFVDFAPPRRRRIRSSNTWTPCPPAPHVGSTAQLRTYHEWEYHQSGAAAPERQRCRLAAANAPNGRGN